MGSVIFESDWLTLNIQFKRKQSKDTVSGCLTYNVILACLVSLVPIQQLYPPLFTLSGARHPFVQLCARNTWKVAFLCMPK